MVQSLRFDKVRNTAVKLLMDAPSMRAVFLPVVLTAYRSYLWIRSVPLSMTRSGSPAVHNLCLPSVPKTGNMWLRTVLSDPVIRHHTGLAFYPPHENWDLHFRFPKYTFVRGLRSYMDYVRIKKSGRYKVCYVVRDPRNIIVSWYHSASKTHRLTNAEVAHNRKILNELDYEAGIRYAIEDWAIRFAYMRTWMYRADADEVLILKFEELFAEPHKEIKKLMNFMNVDISDDVLHGVLDRYSKDKMRQRDRERRIDNESNYGKQSTKWQESLSEENLKFFYDTTGDLVEVLGYER